MNRVIMRGLLGAAAGIAMASGAQAADMPVKAKAVEYVKICTAYGAGFYYIPGTDVCLRVGGYLRADYYHNAPGGFPDITSGNTRMEETHYFRGRGAVILDARTNTAYGTLRSFMNIYASWDTAATGGGNTLGHDRSFIQFAGFTFGQATSFFDFYASSGPHANLANWGGQGTGGSGWNVLAYTAQFGNGLSGTISMEDSRRKAVVVGAPLAVLATTPASVRAGQNVPAFTANLRVDQSWGSAQIMAAWQELRANDTVVASDTNGYAFGGGFTWNNPSAPGSQFGIQAAWAKGALGYIQAGGAGTFIIPDGSSVASGYVADGNVIAGSIERNSGWGVNAGYQHRFNPNWAWSIHGAYTSIEYGAAAALAAGAGTSLDFDVWSLGSRLNWTPVAGLNMGLDIMYHEFETQHVAGVAKGTIGGSQGHWSSMFRVQRDF